MNVRTISRLAAVAGVVFSAAVSSASFVDASILLEKAANNRTVTVKYDGAPAATVELLVNKVSQLTRTLPGTDARGEIALPLDTAMIPDGENTIEVRLLDKDGKLLGSETTKVVIDRSGNGPVFLVGPTVGETVKGFVEVKVGFKSEVRNAYVSFFVNDEFKSLKNYAPYTYSWDSTKVTNGWHEVQAWAVDDENNTFRTEKYRVYVNNPGGLTMRQPVIPAQGSPAKASANPAPVNPSAKPTPATAAPAAQLTESEKPVEVKPVVVRSSGGRLPALPAAQPSKVDPVSPDVPKPQAFEPKPQVSAPVVDLKPTATPAAQTRPVEVKPVAAVPVPSMSPAAAPAVPGVPAETVAVFAPTPIKRGVRLAAVRTFGIVMDGTKMEFDVPGRVKKGVPTAPLRYLFERKGLDVKWNQGDKTVTAKNDSDSFWLQIGNPVARLNGKEFDMESTPYLFKSRTFVPLSFVGEALDVEAVYDPATNHVMILSRKLVAKKVELVAQVTKPSK